jgi:hypothetical protein
MKELVKPCDLEKTYEDQDEAVVEAYCYEFSGSIECVIGFCSGDDSDGILF